MSNHPTVTPFGRPRPHSVALRAISGGAAHTRGHPGIHHSWLQNGLEVVWKSFLGPLTWDFKGSAKNLEETSAVVGRTFVQVRGLRRVLQWL